MRIDNAAYESGGQQLRMTRPWEGVSSGAGDEGNERDRGWRLRGRPVTVTGDELCVYCGRVLGEPCGGPGGSSSPV